VIHVAPGLYNTTLGESFPLNMKPGISLQGAGYVTTVISGVSSSSVVNFPNTGVFSTTDVLSGFTLRGGSAGVFIEGFVGVESGVWARPTIQSNWLTGNGTGLVVNAVTAEVAAPVVHTTWSRANTTDGIFMKAGYSVWYAAVFAVVRGNQILNNGGSGFKCEGHLGL